MTIKLESIFLFVFAFIFALALATNGLAEVSEEQAARLGKDLTPIGAIRAGNEEGTIPRWEGGLPKQPEGTEPRELGGFHDDPYAEDEVRFTITADNYKKYADKLSDGHKAFFEKYPDFKMKVYPTRRSVGSPERIYDLTKKNATRCTLTEDGIGIKGQHGGVPFPIPQNGDEAILNVMNTFHTTGIHTYAPGYIVLPDGDIVNQGGADYTAIYPNNIPGVKKSQYNRMAIVDYVSPPRRKGEILLMLDPKNMSGTEQKIWQYIPGQRRVRRAPGLSYDTPDPSTANLGTFDDSYLYYGKTDRYNWELKGRKELFIMYNNYKPYLHPIEETLKPRFLNPEMMRWELHRVWVVEATLKENSRHCYARRKIYIDEDSWLVVHNDKWDNRGNLWRFQDASMIFWYDYSNPNHGMWIYYDLTETTYAVNACAIDNDEVKEIGAGRADIHDEVTMDMFTPEHLRRMGRR